MHRRSGMPLRGNGLRLGLITYMACHTNQGGDSVILTLALILLMGVIKVVNSRENLKSL